MTERDTAVHAARALLAHFCFWKVLIDLEPVVHPLRHLTPIRQVAAVLDETGYFTHATPAPPLQPRAGFRPADSVPECKAGDCGSRLALA